MVKSRILDLGLARLRVEQSAGGEMTDYGQPMGTVDYMAPEQASDSHNVDIRADIYSLGCTFYQLLTGHAPFSGPMYPNQFAKMKAHVQKPAPSIGSLRDDVPKALAEVLERMLAKTPAERFATPAEVAAAVAPFTAGCELSNLLVKAEELAASPAHFEKPYAPTDPLVSSAHTGTAPGGAGHAPCVREKTRLWETRYVVSLVSALRRRTPVAIGLLFAALAVTLALQVMIRIKDKQGRTVAEVSVPPESEFEIVPNGKVSVKARAEREKPEASTAPSVGPNAPPPLAIAPFDADKAKQHQAAWARHLGVPVETTNSIGMKLVLIPPGEFRMGSPDTDPQAKDNEKPQHPVRITRPYLMGSCEVTQDEYRSVVGASPSSFSATRGGNGKVNDADVGRLPVEQVSWEDANEFCSKLSALPYEQAAKRTYRLPTEAQWEYACRAGSETVFCFGRDAVILSDYGWYRMRADDQMTHAVARKKPNAWELYDMHGNVWEWCGDWLKDNYYRQSPRDDPEGPPSASYRVTRGGCWSTSTAGCRSAARDCNIPTARTDRLGFRVVCEVPAPAPLPRSPRNEKSP